MGSIAFPLKSENNAKPRAFRRGVLLWRAPLSGGRVVEDVRTVFALQNDATIYIPTFELK